jgi:NADH-quinone oxidoreductase subunit C
MKDANAAAETIMKAFPKDITDVDSAGGELKMKATPETLFSLMKHLKKEKECRFDSLMFIGGIDYKENITIVYHLLSIKNGLRATVKTELPVKELKVSSVTGVWPGADWHERETAELFGVEFLGHPDPRKLLLADGDERHPLRKDFKLDWGGHGR